MRQVRSVRKLEAIVAAGMEIAAAKGLQNVTLNLIAERLGVSKSGVFVRVGSLENLQILLMNEYQRAFDYAVLTPAQAEPPGLARLNAIVSRCVQNGHELSAMVSSQYAINAIASQHRQLSEELRTRLIESVMVWRRAIERCVEQALDGRSHVA